MALAQFVSFKYGLHKSCGIECVEGIMLEPCLLQPCYHVAGSLMIMSVFISIISIRALLLLCVVVIASQQHLPERPSASIVRPLSDSLRFIH